MSKMIIILSVLLFTACELKIKSESEKPSIAQTDAKSTEAIPKGQSSQAKPDAQPSQLPSQEEAGGRPASTIIMKKSDRLGVLAEYGHNRVGIMVSPSLLFDYGQSQLFNDILEAGAEKIIILKPNIERLNEDISVSDSHYSKTKKAMKENFAKIELIEGKTSDEVSLWARDWGPIAKRTSAKDIGFVDFFYDSVGYADDQIPDMTAQHYGFKNESSELVFQGGNLTVNAQGHCLVTNRILTQNMDLTETEIASKMSSVLGCEKLSIIPEMPYEPTGHIDIFAKFLSDDTIVLNALSEPTVASILDKDDKTKAKEIQNFLVTTKNALTAMGFKVVSIPMPAPLVSLSYFPSYSNSLIVRETVFVPRYKKRFDLEKAQEAGEPQGPSSLVNNFVNLVDAHLLASYEKDVIAAYESVGYRVKLHEMPYAGIAYVDIFESLLGAIHCLTMQIPLE